MSGAENADKVALGRGEHVVDVPSSNVVQSPEPHRCVLLGDMPWPSWCLVVTSAVMKCHFSERPLGKSLSGPQTTHTHTHSRGLKLLVEESFCSAGEFEGSTIHIKLRAIPPTAYSVSTTRRICEPF